MSDVRQTPEAIAFELYSGLRALANLKTKEELLDLYAECLEATTGKRRTADGGLFSPGY